MAYAGYVRREGKDQLDVGAAVKDVTTGIQSAYEAEKSRREKLSTIGAKGMQQLEDIPTHGHKGVNAWFQQSVTELKTQIYDDFQRLKRGEISDNDYRQRMSNLSDSWKKFSIVAQNWDKDSAAVIKGINEDKFSKLTGALLGQRDQITTDFENTKLVMDDYGNLIAQEYVTEKNKDKYPELQIGDKVEGMSQQLAGLVDPQNILSEKWDVAEQLGAVTSELEDYDIPIDEDGQWIQTGPMSREKADYLQIISDGINVTTANDRTLANSITAMDQSTEYVFNETERINNINKYVENDGIEIKYRTEEIRGGITDASIDKRANEIHKEATKAKDVMTLKEAKALALKEAQEGAEAQARKEVVGDAMIRQIMLATTGQDGSITEPQFIDQKASEDMIIRYRKYNRETGETEDVSEEFKKGDDVPVGDIQKENQIANLAKGIKAYAGRKIRPNTQAIKKTDTVETETQRRARLKVEDEAKNAYLLGRDVAHGNQLDLLESHPKVGEAYRMKDHIGPEGEGQYFIIKNPKGEIIEEIKYDTDDSGDISAEEYETVNNALQPYIQGGTNLANIKKKWEKGKALVGKDEEGKTVDIKTGTPTKRRRYYDLTNPEDFKEARVLIPGTKDTKYTFDQKLEDILVDKSDAGVDDLKEFLVDLSPLESDPIDLSKIGFERTKNKWVGIPNTITVVVKGDKDNAIKIEFDKNYGDKTAEAKTRLKKQITDILKQYHEGPKKKKKTVTELRNENPGITNAELTKLFNNQ